jgi:hypothetical protein
MKFFAALLLGGILLGRAPAQVPPPTPAPEPPLPPAALRVRLMDLGGALANEGFKMRDRVWSGRLESGQPQRLAVHLFRGNQYWFCLAADPESRNPKVSVFGPDGQRLSVLSHAETGLAAAGVTAEATGQYFVQVETEGGPASDFCLLYLFK